MKYLPLALSSLSLIGVAVLFYFHFTADKIPSLAKASGGHEIVFVNIDSLAHNYTAFTQMQKDLESKKTQFDAALQSKAAQFQQAVANYQQTGAGLNPQQRQNAEAQLGYQKQQIESFRDQQTAALDAENQKLLKDAYQKINDYLMAHNPGGRIQYVMNYTRTGGPILFANDSLDITKSLVAGLNSEAKK